MPITNGCVRVSSTPSASSALTTGAISGRRSGQRAYNRATLKTPARLILQDGTIYDGKSFGSPTTSIGEVVFNTSLTGYQEIATDPSYRFQIVVMTYPHIGNYGVEEIVEQHETPQIAGMVVRDIVEEPSSIHSEMSLSNYFAKAKVAAVPAASPASSTSRRASATARSLASPR